MFDRRLREQVKALQEENERLRAALMQEEQRRRIQYDNFFAYDGTARGQKPLEP